MDEWTVVTVLAGLMGLFAMAVKPLIKLNNTITRLDASVSALKLEIETYRTRHDETHNRLWKRLDEQGEAISSLKLKLADRVQIRYGNRRADTQFAAMAPYFHGAGEM
jgi:predicted RNase H-like nuclease (RuvC/YqgF family)